MKSFALIALLFGMNAHAEIANSQYVARHQALLEKAVYESCGAYGSLTQLSSREVEDRVDQGVIDIYYTTEFELIVDIDQGIRDHYRAIAQSAQFSAYDHEAKDWGIYDVLSVTCERQ